MCFKGTRPVDVSEPVVKPKKWEVAWAAGFLEGDGYFGKNKTTVEVIVEQKDRWPVARMLVFFGGSLRQCHRQGINKIDTWRWRVSGDRARKVMHEVVDYMSPRRQSRIKEILNVF